MYLCFLIFYFLFYFRDGLYAFLTYFHIVFPSLSKLIEQVGVDMFSDDSLVWKHSSHCG